MAQDPRWPRQRARREAGGRADNQLGETEPTRQPESQGAKPQGTAVPCVHWFLEPKWLRTYLLHAMQHEALLFHN